MSLHRLVEEFGERACRCRTPQDLFRLTEAAAREIGFDRVALVHGLWFRRPSARLIRLDNFGAWADIFIQRRYYAEDPVLLACQRTNTPFPWSRIHDLVPPTRRHLAIMAEADRHGMHNGFTLPIGVVGEPSGCCSFVPSQAELPPRWQCRAASLIGAEAFREARRLHGFPTRRLKLPRLSNRKFQCLQLLATGQTDDQIAERLGIGVSTVRSHMLALRQDFDVVSRTQLAVEALRFGLISFDDAFPQS